MDAALSNPRAPLQKPQKRILCAHCQSPVPDPLLSQFPENQPAFCCNGCLFVHKIIHQHGLEHFYQLRDCNLPPVQSLVFQRRSFEWISPLIESGNGDFEIEIQGLSCLACVWLIEKLFHQLPGAIQIRVDPLSASAKAKVLPNVFNGEEFASSLHRLGYLAGPPSPDSANRSNRPLTLRIGICTALAMNAMLFSVPAYCGLSASDLYAPIFEKIAFICATLSMAVGATHFFSRAWNALRMRILHIDLPISLGLIAAYLGSVSAWLRGDRQGLYFDFVSMFTLLMLTGRWLRQSAIDKNRRRLLHTPLAVLQPSKDTTYSVNPGQVVPVRSLLTSPEASLGMEWINGEPEARSAFEGHIVPSGAINLSQSRIHLLAKESWGDSLLSGLLKLRSLELEKDPKTQRFILIYLSSVLAVASAGFALWLASGHPIDSALQVLISVLVVSCPCASGVALPLGTEIATANLRQNGVFIREAGLWSRLRSVRRIVFDKTGTLTNQTPQLKDPSSLRHLPPDAKHALSILVSQSLHPIATCLREHLALPATLTTTLTASESVGMGIEFTDPHSGDLWRLGHPHWALTPHSQTETRTVLTKNGSLLAGFDFEEALRPDAMEEIRRLQAKGLTIQILSGDAPERVEKIATALGLGSSQAIGGLTPAQKAEWLANHQAHLDSLMIGDGANDSLAFDASLCCGTPAIDRGLLEHKGDFFYLGRGLKGVRMLLEAAHGKESMTRNVLTFTTTYNLVAVAMALAGKMHPLLAAILMPLSSLVSIGFVMVRTRPKPIASPHAAR